jgi:hypothetical protein
MGWYLLTEREQARSGGFVAVAAASNEMEASLLRSYLSGEGIPTIAPEATHLYPFAETVLIWVPAAKVEEATRILAELAENWQEESFGEGE